MTDATEPNSFPWTIAFAERAARMRSSEIREFLKLLGQPGMISFAGGIPEPDLFPVAAIEAASARILGDPARAAMAPYLDGRFGNARNELSGEVATETGAGG